MLPADADPVLLEARELADALRSTRRAILSDVSGDPSLSRIDLAGMGAKRPDELEDLARTAPERLSTNLLGLAGLHRRLSSILDDERSRGAIRDALDERARQLRIAVAVHGDDQRREALRSRAERLASDIAASGRDPSPAEAELLTVARAGIAAAEAGTRSGTGASTWESRIDSTDRRDAVLDAVARMRLRRARAQLAEGVLLTEQMRAIIAESAPALRRGEPLLLLGETGGGKTALAQHLSERLMGAEPELVSGYGDVTSSQLVGAHELRAEMGATVSAFVPGPLLRAMSEGRPLILDEVNAMPPEFLKRLNRILQLRPGDRFAVQENAGRVVTIAEGFAILATANEQTPHRYLGLERLSAELVNRFGANIYRVHYPDSGLAFDAFPAENALLAAASVCDRRGELPRSLPVEAVERVARAAFISQQVFAGEQGEGFDAYVSTEREIDGRPGLEESVLAPRTLVAVLRKVAGSAGAVDLDLALRRFVEGVMHREDRRVLGLILRGQGFAL
ncbi:AAA family ATPase [Leucobacter weissii]|uniref:AAA family ATPase n=1 Tax=Leucobacter weissii TaxID=1983706 RepID=A0A939SBC6_9MICO|nr:AAA family ATPase [Leucobacter weissii]MBO1902862.1 AAA family ATPase [Leucobacter weissii]